MNKILRMACIAAMALVCNGSFAQDTETFKFPNVTDWKEGKTLDGVSLSRKGAQLTMTFAQNEGENAPVYGKLNGTNDNVVLLYIGNTMTISSEANTITKVKFTFTAGSRAAKNGNYQMTDGDYTSGQTGADGKPDYTWTGTTSNFTLKNLSASKGIEMRQIDVTYVSGTTGISNTVTLDIQKDGKVYDLSGRFVGNDVKSVKTSGVYIVGGKKIAIKK